MRRTLALLLCLTLAPLYAAFEGGAPTHALLIAGGGVVAELTPKGDLMRQWRVGNANDDWRLPNGEWFDWKLNEHCLLLVGYDDDHYWFNDPWHNHGLCPQPKALVETCHRAQGMYAVALRRK